jgi:hypothetical protein
VNAINKTLSYLLAASAAALAAFPAVAGFANSIALPTNVVSALRKSASILVSPMPAAKVERICPVMSDVQLSPDKSLAVVLVDGPFCLTAVSKNGKAVELSVPVKPGGKERVKRWFAAEDVFGNVKWNLRNYKTKTQNLLYFARGGKPVELTGRIAGNCDCMQLGTATVGKTGYKVILRDVLRPMAERHALANKRCVVLAREAPPVNTMGGYHKRVGELYGEYVFRSGAPWGSGHFPIISWRPKHRRFACAAFANDFSMYVFGKPYDKGSIRFTDPEEIRTGDCIRLSGNGHKVIVAYRDGEKLYTIEGNLNKTMQMSTTRHRIKDGKLFRNGAKRKMSAGFHLWNPPKDAKDLKHVRPLGR